MNPQIENWLDANKQPDENLLAKGIIYLPNYLNEHQQKSLYEYLFQNSKSTGEHERIESLRFKETPWPLLQWRNIYTFESNVEKEPTEILEQMQQIFDFYSPLIQKKSSLTEIIEIKQLSGDILFADFGNILHAVCNVNGEEAPDWWKDPSSNKLNRARCNVQLRDTNRLTYDIAKRRMTHDQYMKFVEYTAK